MSDDAQPVDPADDEPVIEPQPVVEPQPVDVPGVAVPASLPSGVVIR